eukprot:591574-Amorphochlora_amoeboformis.AAC.1
MDVQWLCMYIEASPGELQPYNMYMYVYYVACYVKKIMYMVPVEREHEPPEGSPESGRLSNIE